MVWIKITGSRKRKVSSGLAIIWSTDINVGVSYQWFGPNKDPMILIWHHRVDMFFDTLAWSNDMGLCNVCWCKETIISQKHSDWENVTFSTYLDKNAKHRRKTKGTTQTFWQNSTKSFIILLHAFSLIFFSWTKQGNIFSLLKYNKNGQIRRQKILACLTVLNFIFWRVMTRYINYKTS